MTWVYEALEMHDRRGKPLGKYRVVRWEYSHPDCLQGLCDHHHVTQEDALSCAVANRILEEQFSEVPRVVTPRLS